MDPIPEEIEGSGGGKAAILLMCGVAFITIAWFYRGVWFQSTPDLLEEAQQRIEENDYEEAERAVQKLLTRTPDDEQVQWLAAQVAHGQKQFEDALVSLQKINDARSQFYLEAKLMEGDIYLMEQHRLEEAEAAFRLILNQNESDRIATNRIAYILGFGMRDHLFREKTRQMISRNNLEMVHLCLFVLGTERLFQSEDFELKFKANPNDRFVQLPAAYRDWKSGNHTEAIQRIQNAIRRESDAIDHWTMWGQISLEQGHEQSITQWMDVAPENANSVAEGWFLKGNYYRMQQQKNVAIRCYYECIQRDPNHRTALYQLGQLLVQEGLGEQARPYLDRSEHLRKYEDTVVNAWNTNRISDLRLAATFAKELDLHWEELGWLAILQQKDPENMQELISFTNLQSRAMDWPSSRSSFRFPKNSVEEFPLPKKKNGESSVSNPSKEEKLSTVSFVDSAKSSDLNFSYLTDRDPSRGLFKMYEVLGSGVSVLDYDCDGFTDIYFPQRSKWPPNRGEGSPVDQLFRNLDGKSFSNTTAQSGIHESGFSHCATVGDVNNDGFPDLYVTNIGQNRLFINHGDGTYSEETVSLDQNLLEWSVGGAFADFDRDGDLDLYVVNYLEGDDVFTRVCDSNGTPHSCQPQVFSPAKDRVFENLGDGSWREISEGAGIIQDNGNGLGVIVFDANQDLRPDVFVANDVAPNHLYINESTAEKTSWKFSEQAILSGLAVNESGTEEACMGISLGDVDGDGNLDLFVTNFENETNTLYRQLSPGVFEDVTERFGLGKTSRPMLGFGTEFLDGDNDGWLDLIVTNGHINKFPDQDRQFEMASQFYTNAGGSRFELESSNKLGPFFNQPILGRGLACLDWNRDGLQDFVLSRIDGLACLLTNQTQTDSQSLQIQVRGSLCHRDAFGAVVTVQTNLRKMVRVSGSSGGYMSVNENQLHFGLNDSELVQKITILWPNGTEEKHLLPERVNKALLVQEKELLASDSSP